MSVNRSASERRAATISARRSVKKEYQAAWLIRAIQCIDLTTLAGDDTAGRVRRLCAKARRPVREDILEALGLADAGITTGAVCVYPTMVPHAVKALEGSGIPVASVATGFPAGLTPLPLRLAEITYAVEQGAHEIDIVITREHVLTQNWSALYDEIAAMREACGDAHMKAILATGDLNTLTNVYRASMVAMQAGSDFIKTSTGKEDVNATLPVSLTMVRALRDYGALSGQSVGFKPGRPQERQGCARLAHPDEGRTRQSLAGTRSVPHRRIIDAWRYRTAIGALRDRALLRRQPSRCCIKFIAFLRRQKLHLAANA